MRARQRPPNKKKMFGARQTAACKRVRHNTADSHAGQLSHFDLCNNDNYLEKKELRLFAVKKEAFELLMVYSCILEQGVSAVARTSYS